MCQTDKCVVARGLKVVLNTTYHHKSYYNRLFKNDTAFRFIEISKYDDGGQVMSAAKLCLEVDRVSVPSPIAIDILMDTMARDRAHMYLFSV